MPLSVKSDSVTEHLLLGSFEFRLSPPPSCPLTCLLQIVVGITAWLPNGDFADASRAWSSFVGATEVKPESAPMWCYHKGFPRSSLRLFPNKFDFYFLYFCFLWAPHCLLVLIFFWRFFIALCQLQRKDFQNPPLSSSPKEEAVDHSFLVFLFLFFFPAGDSNQGIIALEHLCFCVHVDFSGKKRL